MNRQMDALFDALISQFDREKQATLKMMYLRCVQAEEARQRQEYDKLKKEIVVEVLQKISVSADIKDAVIGIREIKHALDDLTKI